MNRAPTVASWEPYVPANLTNAAPDSNGATGGHHAATIVVLGVCVERFEIYLPNAYQVARIRDRAALRYAAWVTDGEHRYLAVVTDRRIHECSLSTDEAAASVLAEFWEHVCGDANPQIEFVPIADVTAVATRIRDIPRNNH